MHGRFIRLVCLALFLAVIIAPQTSQATTIVNPGWDLFETLPGTMFLGHEFTGVPLATFDFGGPIGRQNIGATDTIVQRLNQADGGGEKTAKSGRRAHVGPTDTLTWRIHNLHH